MNKLKNELIFIKNNWKRFILLFYMPLYMSCFTWLETHNERGFFLVQSKVDSYIPFLEIFIIPYLLWFFYMFYGIFYMIFRKNGMDFYLMATFLSIGMTLFLIISYVYPNKIDIRPTYFTRNNIFIDLVKALYKSDTPTNVLPSIHVFNSVVINEALCRTERYNNKTHLKFLSKLFTLLVVLSTMFLKQHTVIDVAFALVLIIALYPFIYGKKNTYLKKFWEFYDKKHLCNMDFKA